MARVCQVTGKAPMVGHQVSHANNKTKRRFMPNLQYRRFGVESDNRWVRLRLTNAGLRTVDKLGIDAVLADLRARGEIELHEIHHGERRSRQDQARFFGWYGSLLHHDQEPQDHFGQDGNFQVRPGCSQARRLQGNEAQVILTASYSERSELKEPDAGCAAPGFFVLILY